VLLLRPLCPLFQFLSLASLTRWFGVCIAAGAGRSPCKQISPEYARLSQQYSDIAFAKVDVDVCEEAAQTAKISSMPTFQFFKFGEVSQLTY